MTFDEWVTANGLDYLRACDHEAVLFWAEEAWKAAAYAERERCAITAERTEPTAEDYREADALERSAWDIMAARISLRIREGT